jgi:NitT/TauT family transport system ATP-binding protein
MIELKDISLFFHEENILDNITYKFKKNKVTAILGPSGGGKTSLFNIIAGIETNYSGEVIKNFDNVGYIFQEDRLLSWESVKDNLNIIPGATEEKILHILKLLHIPHKVDHLVKNLSGGEKQRVAIARAFLYDTELILMDESLKSLDFSLKIKLIDLIISLLEKYSKTLIMISHDIDEILLMADEVIIFSKKPTVIEEVLIIDFPKSKRTLSSKELKIYKNKIYDILLK